VRDKILAALEPADTDWIVELGPGPGVLTAPLSERCAHLVAVELDAELATRLPQVVPQPARLEARCEDGVHLDYHEIAQRAGQRLRVVGNLPFNAATAMLGRALAFREDLERLVLMFQREVGARLVAREGSRRYGRLTVITAARARVRRLFEVAPGSFAPAPKVAATVLRLDPRRDALAGCCLDQLDNLTSRVFAHRRKTLRNGLRGAPWPWSLSEALLHAEGLEARQRAEQISVCSFERLARALCEARGLHAATPAPGRGSGPALSPPASGSSPEGPRG
jgi:16S rRNA (adenine1518-N6/adenine1519-N6)-dimethyltransferase